MTLPKNVLLRMILPCSVAFAVIVLIDLILWGPQLGWYYDFLNQHRPAPPLAKNIVIIETDYAGGAGTVEPVVLQSTLLTLIEMRSDSLVVQAPIYSSAVPPDDERELQNLVKAITAFGTVSIDESPQKTAVTDPDGKMRRVAPLVYTTAGQAEHLVYRNLKSQVQSAGVAIKPYRILPEFARNAGNKTLFQDARDSLLIDPPHGTQEQTDFIRLPLSAFIEYEFVNDYLQRLLVRAGTMDVYRGLSITQQPTFFGEYARSLRDIMLEAPDPERKQAWLQARGVYFDRVEDFFYGAAVQDVLADYDKRIAAASKDEQRGMLTAQRTELITLFEDIRGTYTEMLQMGARLEAQLQGAFCVMGPVQAGENATVRASAALANALLTVHSIVPGAQFLIVLLSAALACLVVLLLWQLDAFGAGIVGFLCVVSVFLAFSVSFVFTAYWIDPLIPASAVASGALVSFIFAPRPAAPLRFSSTAPVLKPMLIVAIQNTSQSGDTINNAQIVILFQKRVTALFSKSDGIIVGSEKDTMFIAFNLSPAGGASTKTIGTLVDMLHNHQESAAWYMGVDAGEVALSSTAVGYAAFGEVLNRAQTLASLAPRHHARILISGAAYQGLRMAIEELDTLKENDGGEGDSFYQLM